VAFSGVFLLAIQFWSSVISGPCALAQATLAFQNFYPRSDGTNFWREDRPIFLADGITRASGSNYVVELWYLNALTQGPLRFAGQTYLLGGDFAGLFRGGQFGSVELPFVAPCGNAVIEIRAWDSTTGTNYESAATRGNTAFENWTGGCGLPPTIPAYLEGFKSFCLGRPNCFTNVTMVDFSSDYLQGGGYSGALSSNEFIIASSAGFKTILVHRSGDLTGSSVISYSTSDETAVSGVDYTMQTGSLTFQPLETIKTFDIPVLTNSLPPRAVSLRLHLTSVAGAEPGTKDGRLWILGDRASLITWLHFPGIPDGITPGIIFGCYWQDSHAPTVEFTDDLRKPDWSTLVQFGPTTTTRPFSGFAPDGQWRAVPQRYYRVVVR
jgi:hypothetical protein